MPDLDEPRRQNVETEAAEELRLLKRHRADLTAVGIVFVLERNRAGLGIQRLQSAVGDGDTMRIATQVGQHRLRTGKRSFGVGHPFMAAQAMPPTGEDRRVCELRFCFGELQVSLVKQLLQTVTELGAKDQRQGPDRE